MPRKINLLVPISWTILITLLSVVKIGSFGNSLKIPYKDKMIHFVFYFIFYVLWFAYFNQSRKTKAITILVFAIGYGILMEVVQALIKTNRSADIIDVVANSLGALSGLLFTHYYPSNKKPI